MAFNWCDCSDPNCKLSHGKVIKTKVKRVRRKKKAAKGIFQINEYQLSVLKTNSGGQKYVSLVPDKERDGDSHAAWLQHTEWNEQLVAEGLMKEVSTEGDEFIARMEEFHKRKYKMYKLTPLAIAMFTPVLVPGDEPDTYRNVADTIH